MSVQVAAARNAARPQPEARKGSRPQVRGGSERGDLQTLVNGLDVLELIAESSGDVTAQGIAQELDLTLGRTYHLLRTLENSGYTGRRARGGYRVLPRGLRLGRLLQEAPHKDPGIHRILQVLRQRTGETCYVVGWEDDNLVIKDLLVGTQSVVVRGLEVGYEGNIHARASCKAILAYLPVERAMSLLGQGPYRRMTRATVTSPEQMAIQLARARGRGYAVEFGEFNPDSCCIGAAFFDAVGGPLGSFAVSVPSARFSSARQLVETAVREAAVRATLYHSGVSPTRLRADAAREPGEHGV